MARGAIYSKQLGINLESKTEKELFKWLLACLLFGRPIGQSVAARTFREFVASRLTSPRSIKRAGWDKLVEVLDRGHYVRFDYSTATKILAVCEELKSSYGSVS